MEFPDSNFRWLAVVLGLIATVSLWGWGMLLRHAAGMHADGDDDAPVVVALGLSLVLFLGGILNLTQVAFAATVDAVAAAGVLAAIFYLIRGHRPKLHGSGPIALAGWSPVIVVAAFLFVNQFPQQAFNFHDDFEKYFAHPVRMLATGTLGGNPLSSVGSETLGAQAFLHGLAAAHLPIAYLGVVDGFFGLLLCLALIRPTGVGRIWPGFLAQGVLIAVNPQIVNVGAHYAAIALIAVYVLGMHRISAAKIPVSWRSLTTLGLIGAGLIALKTTFAAFVVGFPAVFLGIHYLSKQFRPVPLRLFGVLTGWTVIALLPWVLLHAPLYRDVLGRPAREKLPDIVLDRPGLFSTVDFVAGFAPLLWTILALGLLWCGVGSFLAARRTPADRGYRVTAAALLTGSVLYLPFFFHVGTWVDLDTAIRYFTPIAMGCLGGAALLLTEIPPAVGIWFRLGAGLSAGVVALAAGLFLPSLAARVGQIASSGTPLAFLRAFGPGTAGYLTFNKNVLADGQRERMQAIQSRVPAGEPLVALVSTPFWFDYGRNPTFETNPAGLGASWARVPDGRYFAWEYRGYAIRQPEVCRIILETGGAFDRWGIHCLMVFQKSLTDAARSAEILYDDGGIVLFRIRP